VGNDPDVTKNPSCGITVAAAGVFKCNLVGKYIGLIQNNNEYLHLCELRAFAWENIEATGFPEQSTTLYPDLSADRPIDPDNLKIGDTTHQTTIVLSSEEPNPWWRLSFTSSKFINMVSVIGNFYPGFLWESENMEIWVGDSLTPTDNTKYGATFNYQTETPVNAYGQHVFVRRGDG